VQAVVVLPRRVPVEVQLCYLPLEVQLNVLQQLLCRHILLFYLIDLDACLEHPLTQLLRNLFPRLLQLELNTFSLLLKLPLLPTQLLPQSLEGGLAGGGSLPECLVLLEGLLAPYPELPFLLLGPQGLLLRVLQVPLEDGLDLQQDVPVGLGRVQWRLTYLSGQDRREQRGAPAICRQHSLAPARLVIRPGQAGEAHPGLLQLQSQFCQLLFQQLSAIVPRASLIAMLAIYDFSEQSSLFEALGLGLDGCRGRWFGKLDAQLLPLLGLIFSPSNVPLETLHLFIPQVQLGLELQDFEP
jgi:hypothetical protein